MGNNEEGILNFEQGFSWSVPARRRFKISRKKAQSCQTIEQMRNKGLFPIEEHPF